MKQRASKFSRSLCETFAFATSETVSIASGNRLIQTVRNVSIFCIFCIFIIFNICYIICFVQAAFNPAGIEFQTFPTMATTIVEAMLPGHEGKVHKLSLHEGGVHLLQICIFHIFCILNLLFQQKMVINWLISIGLIPCWLMRA